MKPQAKSDPSLLCCVHCATALEANTRTCPCCGENPVGDSDFDDASWFGTASSPAQPGSDHILEAMMAIAAAKPRAVVASPAPLVTGPSLVLVSSMPPPVVAAALQPAPVRSPLQRIVLYGTVATAVLAALMAVLLGTGGEPLVQRVAPTAGPALPLATLAPVRDGASNGAGPEGAELTRLAVPGVPAPAPVAMPEASGDESGTIAAALGLGARALQPAPVAVADAAAPAPSAVLAPAAAEAPMRCTEALAALALCRAP